LSFVLVLHRLVRIGWVGGRIGKGKERAEHEEDDEVGESEVDELILRVFPR
jgi:hypothetical protein